MNSRSTKVVSMVVVEKCSYYDLPNSESDSGKGESKEVKVGRKILKPDQQEEFAHEVNTEGQKSC